MGEVKVKGEDLNGLGWTIKSLIDGNMENPKVWANIKKIRGSLVVKETGADVSVTVFFDKGEIEIQDGAVRKPSAHLAAGFDELAEITSGQLGPIRALLTGKIKAGGNLLKLLKMAKAVINREED
ncbi:MAG: SCP2 sterol-binding domain-containing protein [Deltaproteobacteria bacterium]|nr:SCP2 sterol-binding domain-containing protein [Deltaproteobacteria bacterium]MBL7216773.1 SCP2 sterol-binding domain-containing protein [Desulfobacteraceae bacterium]